MRLIESVPDLQRWLAVHPGREDPSAFLFPSRDGGSLTEETFNSLLKRLAEEAGINKRVHPHLLRHTRATHLAKVLGGPAQGLLRLDQGLRGTRQVRAPLRVLEIIM